VRFMSSDLDNRIPTDMEQQTGRRLAELQAEAKGHVAYNREPIYPLAFQGTKEHPIFVRSFFSF